MLAAIIRSALRWPIWVALLGLLLLAIGVGSLSGAKYDVFPEFVPPQASVQVEAPGFSATQVEQLVTQPMENAINGGTNVITVRSQSIQGLSVITVRFEENSDPFLDRQMLSERVSEAAAGLPQGVQAPRISPMTSSTMDLLKIGFVSDRLDPVALRSLIDWSVKPRLLAVSGVAGIANFGGGVRELQIHVKPAQLATFGLTLEDVRLAAAASTGVRGAGYIDTPSQRVILETSGTVHQAAELARTVITQRMGRNITLGDVATVTEGAAPAFGDALIQGRRGVVSLLTSQYGANTLEVTHAVEQALDGLRPLLKAEGVTVYPQLQRPASFIQVALNHMRDALLLGAVLVLVVLIVFLRDWRTALISFVSIPLSLAIATLVMERMGWTINTMTLGGLAVALGVVVDDAIIDVENIMRRLRQAGPSGPRAIIILAASIEVRRPVVLATLVVGLVFVPILLLPGLQGSFFAPMAGAFLLATFASLLVALTVTPALCMLLLKPEARHHEPHWLKRIKLIQHGGMRWAMPRPRLLLAVSALLGIAAIGSLWLFGSQLLPTFREGHYVVQITAPPGTSLAEMTRLGTRLSKDVLKIDGVRTAALVAGRAEAVVDTWPTNRGELHVELAPKLSAHEQVRIEASLRKVASSYPGLSADVVTFLGDRIGDSLSGETAPVAISLYGPDLDELDRLSTRAVDILNTIPGAGSVHLSATPAAPTMRIHPDPVRIARYGMRMTDVLDAVAMAYQGIIATETYDGVQAIGVRVVLDQASRQDPETIGHLLLRTPSGKSVPLAAVADIDLVQGRATISHEGGRRRLVIAVRPTNPDVVGFVDQARAALTQQLNPPTGYYLEYHGAAEGTLQARHALEWHAALAGAGIIALLFMAFPDRRSVGLILVNVPFALVGGVAAAATMGSVLSIGALVGLVTLFGISARNTIMLISHYEHLVLEEGAHWNRFTAMRGARERLTPILMTALVTGLGLLPLALGNGEAGREVEGPMAVVILGGLITSTLLNLLVMPALSLRYLRMAAPPHDANQVELLPATHRPVDP
ncbi:MAG: efflux RND transporter permease subunit [Xanthomonadaceae bacterium]|nr:efflux RND transporter permease subunit [Xanthomonadaceae bacterium]